MIKLVLNTHKFNNYAFFCPVSRLHLTVSNPVGYTNEVTAAILKGLKTKAILDVDDMIDVETGTVKVKGAAVVNVQNEAKPVQTPEQSSSDSEIEDKQDNKAVEESKAEAPAEERPKRGKKVAASKEDAAE